MTTERLEEIKRHATKCFPGIGFITELIAEVERLRADAKVFPIQLSAPVRWSDAERAYQTYSRLFGTDQSLARLAERGGFGVNEFVCLWRGHMPGRCDVSCPFFRYERKP